VTRLSMTLGSSAGAAGTFVAQLLSRSTTGAPTSKTVLLQLGVPTVVDVEPGPIQVQVRLPSGDVLTDERTIVAGHDEAITFSLRGSRHEWLGWQNVLSPETDATLRGNDSFPVGEPWITQVRVHQGGNHIDVPIDKGASFGGATFSINRDNATFSLTVEGYRQPPPLVELVMSTGAREIVALPLPWYDKSEKPLPVQLICELIAGGTRADVIVHDAEFSPVLAYYAGGNFAAAREVAPFIVDRAEMAIMNKFHNPVAGAAGVLVLRRLEPKRVDESWLQNLAGISSISDGAVLYASYLMATRERRSDMSRIHKLVLDVRRRGMPIFVECVQILNDLLTRLNSATDRPAEINEAYMWTRHLMVAARADTIITWLAADDRSLSRIVPTVVAPPSK